MALKDTLGELENWFDQTGLTNWLKGKTGGGGRPFNVVPNTPPPATRPIPPEGSQLALIVSGAVVVGAVFYLWKKF